MLKNPKFNKTYTFIIYILNTKNLFVFKMLTKVKRQKVLFG